jgi:hypothetical protein
MCEPQTEVGTAPGSNIMTLPVLRLTNGLRLDSPPIPEIERVEVVAKVVTGHQEAPKVCEG